jgi:hypothetical protein
VDEGQSDTNKKPKQALILHFLDTQKYFFFFEHFSCPKFNHLLYGTTYTTHVN